MLGLSIWVCYYLGPSLGPGGFSSKVWNPSIRVEIFKPVLNTRIGWLRYSKVIGL